MVGPGGVIPPHPRGVLSFPPLLLALALLCHPPASTAYQPHHLRFTSSSGSSCEHNGARIHLGQPYPPLCLASPSALRRSRHPSFSSYLAGTASRNNSIFLCEYNFAFNLFSPLFPSLLLSRAPGYPNSRRSSLSLSLYLSPSLSLLLPFRCLRCVAFSTNLLRHLHPPSTERGLSLYSAPSSLPLSVTRAPSFVQTTPRSPSVPFSLLSATPAATHPLAVAAPRVSSFFIVSLVSPVAAGPFLSSSAGSFLPYPFDRCNY